MKRFGLLCSVIVGMLFVSSAPVAANVNNFTISDYKVDMVLGIDSEGRSTLKTTEIITAEFPDYDQNRGIERAIPKTYKRHKTNIGDIAVTDESGKPRVYTTYDDDNGNLVVRMADMSKYVRGTQVYKLIYTQHDVTAYFADSDSDEFYWDINGTDWRVPIDRLETHITIEDDLVGKLSGNVACYVGTFGSSDRCAIAQKSNEFSTISTNLARGYGVTVAIGFAPNTFEPYEMTLVEKIMYWWSIWQGISFAIAAAALIWLALAHNRIVNRKHQVGSIAPEYIPPSDTSVTVSSLIGPTPKGSVMTAQLLDLAVRHYIKLHEVKKKKWYRAAEYEIEIVKGLKDLKEEEKELLSDSFGYLPTVGKRLNLKKLKNNKVYYRRTLDNDEKLRDLIRGKYELRYDDVDSKKRFRKTALKLGVMGVVLLSVPLVFASLVVFAISFTFWSLTDKGLALRRYLEGLKLYIGVAETDRLQMLQSPDGASKIASTASGTDQKSLIKLYERVLPYAVLFGQEKDWSKQLGTYYEQANAQPDWYAGQSAFNAAAFTSTIGGISQAASYASSSSSSSGGSSGGGSSGGGGGGGGGGGI